VLKDSIIEIEASALELIRFRLFFKLKNIARRVIEGLTMFKAIILSCVSLAIFILGMQQLDSADYNIMLFEPYKGNTFLFLLSLRAVVIDGFSRLENLVAAKLVVTQTDVQIMPDNGLYPSEILWMLLIRGTFVVGMTLGIGYFINDAWKFWKIWSSQRQIANISGRENLVV